MNHVPAETKARPPGIQRARDERASSVVGGDEVHGRPVVLAEHPADRLEWRQDPRIDADRDREIARPVAGRNVQEAGRARVRALADGLSRQLVGDELRQHHQSLRPGQLVAVVGRELEDRVDGHELDPRAAVQLALVERVGDAAPPPVRGLR